MAARQSRDHGFRWRSREPARIEGLSDAVFAFAVTLLVVSLEVPRTFAQLEETMMGFIGFAMSFALLALIWHTQYTFFRRYGLDDGLTIVLNLLLLFLVLFYVYPLKFLTAALTNLFTGGGLQVALEPGGAPVPMISHGEWLTLMLIYSVGFMAVFGVFTLLYWHAYRLRDALELTPEEVIETRASVLENALQTGVGALVASVIATTHWYMAPLFYVFIAPAQMLQGAIRRRARERLAGVGAAE